MEIDWNLIKSFVTVAETGSLSAAARKLAASQPTLGRHIAELEQALGVTLFRRGRRGYALTEAGSTLYERGRAVSEQASAFSLLALGSVEAIEGTVRIAASEVVAAYVLPEMTARLGAEEPGIEVEIVASNQVENLLRRDADIAIRMVKPAQNEVVARKVADIPLRACAAKSYLDRRGRPREPGDLAGHDLIGFDRSDEIIRGFAQVSCSPAMPSASGPTTKSCCGRRCGRETASALARSRWPTAIRWWRQCCRASGCRRCRYGWPCTATYAPACASAVSRISSMRS